MRPTSASCPYVRMRKSIADTLSSYARLNRSAVVGKRPTSARRGMIAPDRAALSTFAAGAGVVALGEVVGEALVQPVRRLVVRVARRGVEDEVGQLVRDDDPDPGVVDLDGSMFANSVRISGERDAADVLLDRRARGRRRTRRGRRRRRSRSARSRRPRGAPSPPRPPARRCRAPAARRRRCPRPSGRGRAGPRGSATRTGRPRSGSSSSGCRATRPSANVTPEAELDAGVRVQAPERRRVRVASASIAPAAGVGISARNVRLLPATRTTASARTGASGRIAACSTRMDSPNVACAVASPKSRSAAGPTPARTAPRQRGRRPRAAPTASASGDRGSFAPTPCPPCAGCPCRCRPRRAARRATATSPC